MVTVRIRGGLGNQLFTYACGYAVAKTFNEELTLDISDYNNGYFRGFKLDNFKINDCYRISNKFVDNKIGRLFMKSMLSVKYNIVKEKSSTEFQSEVFNMQANMYLYGYWQNENYFRRFENEIKRQFTPTELSDNVKDFILQAKGCNSIAVHIRRGDYVNNQWLLDMSYYDRAIDYILEKVENPMFFFFSDDIEWVKEYFGNKTCYKYNHFEKSPTDLDEFFSMSYCDHMIIANSTFSWWAAWLNENPNKIVMAPSLDIWSGDYYPNHWIQLNANKAKN